MSFFGGILKGIGKGAKAVGNTWLKINSAGNELGSRITGYPNPLTTAQNGFGIGLDRTNGGAPDLATPPIVNNSGGSGVIGALNGFLSQIQLPHLTVDTQLNDEGERQSKSLLLWIVGGVALLMFFNGRRRY